MCLRASFLDVRRIPPRLALAVTKETKRRANEGQRRSVGVGLRSLVTDRNSAR